MTAHQMLAKVRDLPPVSSAALQLVSLLDRTDAANEDIVRVLRQDAVLTAKLLRLCNSSAMALKEKVTSVDQAVFLLGHAQIFQMVMALAFRGPLTVVLRSHAAESNALWHHSLLAATAAELAVSGGLELGVDSSTAFTVGLLHDIGKLVTTQFATEETSNATRALVARGLTAVQAEREIWGTDHAEVGTGLMYLWHLPEEIVDAVGRHHQPILVPQPRLSALASLANHAAHRAGEQYSQSAPPAGESDLLEAFGFTTEKFEELVGRLGGALDTNALAATV